MNLRHALSALAVLFLAGPQASESCCAVRPKEKIVQIADQEIVVVWDQEKKREHFIRQAKFDTNSDDFGFLVPTPTQPELEEADAAIFTRLNEATKPVVKTKYLTTFKWTFFNFTKGARMKSKRSAAVKVLEKKMVAGFQAVVLAATDTKALGAWLKEHGYDTRPEMLEWVKPYVKERWILTAFKFVAKRPIRDIVPTKAIRMSFDTERPLFPYRVPTDNITDRRHLLRVHFIGPKRVQGFIGKDKKSWGASTRYADSRSDIAKLLSGSGPAAEISGTWLTSFDDQSWPSSVEDLYFEDAPKQEAKISVRVEEKDITLSIEFIIFLVMSLVALRIMYALFKKTPPKSIETEA